MFLSARFLMKVPTIVLMEKALAKPRRWPKKRGHVPLGANGQAVVESVPSCGRIVGMVGETP